MVAPKIPVSHQAVPTSPVVPVTGPAPIESDPTLPSGSPVPPREPGENKGT
jgi:hypothetical protein